MIFLPDELLVFHGEHAVLIESFDELRLFAALLLYMWLDGIERGSLSDNLFPVSCRRIFNDKGI